MSDLFDLFKLQNSAMTLTLEEPPCYSNSKFKIETVECFTPQIILVDSCCRASQFGSLSIGETIESP